MGPVSFPITPRAFPKTEHNSISVVRSATFRHLISLPAQISAALSTSSGAPNHPPAFCPSATHSMT
jgi:hypothetical protein